MKKTDIAMIILVAALAIGVTFITLRSLPFFQEGTEPVTVKTAEAISTDLADPSTDIFFENAINPTVKIVIGTGEESNATAPSSQAEGDNAAQQDNE